LGRRFFVKEGLCVKNFIIQRYRLYGLILLHLRLLFFLQFSDKVGQTLFTYRGKIILPAKVQVIAQPFFIGPLIGGRSLIIQLTSHHNDYKYE